MKTPTRKMTVPAFREAAERGQKLTMLTAYDYLWAGIMDEAGVDSILVGDSLAMVVQGKSTTLPVTLDQMIYHGELVTRAVQRALVIVDMPFMSYQVSPQQAVENAGRIMKETGADAIGNDSRNWSRGDPRHGTYRHASSGRSPTRWHGKDSARRTTTAR